MDGVGDNVGDLAEAVVAVDVAEEVVVLLEEIDVDHEQREGLVGDQGAAPFLLEALVEAAAVGQAGEAVERGQEPIAGFALQKGDFELLALFKQSGHEEAGEEGDGQEDLDVDDAVEHAVIGDQHERAVAVDGKRDGDEGDDADGQDRAWESEAEDDHQQRGDDKEDEWIVAIGEDGESREGGDEEKAKGVEHSATVQHVEEAGAKEDEDQGRHDGHPQHVAEPPGPEESEPRAGFDEHQCPGSAERAGDGGGADHGDEEEAYQGPAAGEVEGMAEDVGENQDREDDLDGVGDRDTEGESEPIAVEDVGERIGAEANGEVLDPEVAGAKDDEGEEHPVGEPDGGDTFGGVRELDAQPGEEEQNEEGEGELHIVREAAPRRRWECVGVKKALRVWLREGLDSHG